MGVVNSNSYRNIRILRFFHSCTVENVPDELVICQHFVPVKINRHMSAKSLVKSTVLLYIDTVLNRDLSSRFVLRHRRKSVNIYNRAWMMVYGQKNGLNYYRMD